MDTIKHYIRHDEQNRVIKGFSTAFEQPLETDTCTCEDGDRHFEFDGEINPPLFLENRCPKYKGLMELMTEEDIAQWLLEQPTPQLSEQEQRMQDLEMIVADLLGGI